MSFDKHFENILFDGIIKKIILDITRGFSNKICEIKVL